MGYLEEMAEQADVLEAFFQAGHDQVYRTDLARLKRYRRVIFTGMGSSYFAGWYGAILLNRCGVPAYALEAGEMEKEFLPGLTEDVLLVAISQSGESPETVRCLENIKGKHALGITNRLESSLPERCECGVVNIRAGREQASATKSYTNTLAALLRLAMDAWGYRIPGFDTGLLECMATMRTWLREAGVFRATLGGFFEDTAHLVFLGSGLSLTSARQAALVFGEMTHRLTAAQSIGQYFHGLIEQTSEDYGAVLFHSSVELDSHYSEAVDTFLNGGGRVVLVGPSEALEKQPKNTRCLIMSHPVQNEELASVLEILPAQFLAYELGKKAGLEPGELARVQKIH